MFNNEILFFVIYLKVLVKKIGYKNCMEPGVLGSFSWQTLFLLTIYCII